MLGTVLKLDVSVLDQPAKLSNLLYESRHILCCSLVFYQKLNNAQCNSIDIVTRLLLPFTITKQQTKNYIQSSIVIKLDGCNRKKARIVTADATRYINLAP